MEQRIRWGGVGPGTFCSALVRRGLLRKVDSRVLPSLRQARAGLRATM
jgi:hypothetical protein